MKKVLLAFCSLHVLGCLLLFFIFVQIENKRPNAETLKDDNIMYNHVNEKALILLKDLVQFKHLNESIYSRLLRFFGFGKETGHINHLRTEIGSTDSGWTVIHRKEQESQSRENTNRSRIHLGKYFTETRAAGVTTRKCSLHPGDLNGREKVNPNVHSMDYLEHVHFDFQHGGRWRPSNCSALLRVAIIIPYRDKEQHLKVLLMNLIPKLQRQLIDFTIYVVEQKAGSNFNRGMMRNIGFLEASKEYAYDCYIFNEVDTIIENDKNLYTCRTGAAHHMAATINVNKYSLLYEENIGGILSLAGSDFKMVNGYSNFFFFWRGEDDNLYTRLTKHGITVSRPPRDIAIVTMLQHKKEPKYPERFTVIRHLENMGNVDGLRNIRYSNVTVLRQKLFTKISVSVNQTLYEQILVLYMNTQNLQNLAVLSDKNASIEKFNVDNDDNNITFNDVSADKSQKYFTFEGFSEKNPETLLKMMKSRTGKVWVKMGDYNYKNVFDVCPVNKSSEGKRTVENTPNSGNKTCPSCPSDLRGREKALVWDEELSFLEEHFSDFDVGGHWAPKWCKPSKNLAIIIPYRNRSIHLTKLLYNLIPKLQRQLADFTIYVVEQEKNSSFNRGLMRNIGFLQASKDRKYDCYVFNDVDTLIEDDRNIYTCVEDTAYHMTSLIDSFDYKLLYTTLIGGILGVTENVFRTVNGYSNFLFSWGGEDDDLYFRLVDKKFVVTRPEINVSRSKTFKHSPVDRFVTRKGRLKLTYIRHFWYKDGLNTVKTEKLKVERRKLFTWIHASVNETYYNKMLAIYAIHKKIEMKSGWIESRKALNNM